MILCPRQEPEQINDAPCDYGGGSNSGKSGRSDQVSYAIFAGYPLLIWPMSVRPINLIRGGATR
jgi:hypothetical protein